jgi:hypothetical protein
MIGALLLGIFIGMAIGVMAMAVAQRHASWFRKFLPKQMDEPEKKPCIGVVIVMRDRRGSR